MSLMPPLYNLIKGAFSALNSTKSDLTQSCWLCLSEGPPYYEGTTYNGTYNNTDSCSWGRQGASKLTLSEVSGQGLCLGTPPPEKSQLCARTEKVTAITGKYLAPSDQGWWACNTGLTACISPTLINQTGFCVLVHLYPRVIYHDSPSFEEQMEGLTHRYKREPVTMTLAVLMGLGTVAGIAAGMGSAAYVQGYQHMEQLKAAIAEDLRGLEASISALETSLTSLSEVVLQNRRGLDLVFIRDGGLCATLKEECCFYADHTGVVRDSMAKLCKRLEERKWEKAAGASWFENWWSKSPWLTTLLSALAGPIIILLLLFTFGPYILNRLLQFIRERLSITQAMVLTQQYQALRTTDTPQDNIQTP
ncbi:LOW QUALITY PROTEIN: MLV-related proviral Env polyprotein-like [Onychomys torridus]|uniref:LOW QUALITY PROTEIN: MLV-related proviral Env polyprotein-like n=1 Tax=Onychomys torridus TaxID=38674 RepID=UPI00167F8E1F|nr:LOW QUALITY PROTEIN: MLV-related proviral Env polyprotein-like [Onychomys torridus]